MDDKYKDELRAYIHIGAFLIRKKDILIGLLLILALSVTALGVLMPLYREHFADKTLFTNSKELETLNAFGRIYDLDRNLLYEGTIANGTLSGLGRLYSPSGRLLYEGGFENSLFSGNGKLFDDAGVLRYDGPFKDNQYYGKGLLYDSNGALMYDGPFENGQYFGQGKLYKDSVLLYSGAFRVGVYDGAGILYDGEGNLLFEGSFQNGEYHGNGKLFHASGKLRYEGAFENGKYCGDGKLYEDGTLLYAGSFKDGEYDGVGILYGANGGSIYEGGFQNGAYHGNGKLFYGSGALRYEGGFAHGKFSGQGVEMSAQERIKYQGAFSSGMRNGFGTLYSDDGVKVYNGLFLNGVIDYVSLLGIPYANSSEIFFVRKYVSDILIIDPLSYDEAYVEETSGFLCECYEQLGVALIYDTKGGIPGYCEAVVVWNDPGFAPQIDGEADYDIPKWMDAFLRNERCPQNPKLLKRYISISGDKKISAWTDFSSDEFLWYSIEYIDPEAKPHTGEPGEDPADDPDMPPVTGGDS